MNSSYTNYHLGRLAPVFHETLPCHRTRIHQTIRLLLALLLAVLCAPSARAQWYTPTEFVLPDGSMFAPTILPGAMNDNGQIAGSHWGKPAVWHNGMLTYLPLLPGTQGGDASGINNSGQVVGHCVGQACIWENGTVRALAIVEGATSSAATAINEVGTIVGHVFSSPPSSPYVHQQAVVWQGNSVGKSVPPIAGADTMARAIDDFGRVAVSWNDYRDFDSAVGYLWRAARWTPDVPNGTTGTMTTLGYGTAFDINNAGVIAGALPDWAGSEYWGVGAFVWDESNLMDIGGDAALSLNDAGTVVGQYVDPWSNWSEYHQKGSMAFVWNGYWTQDLNYVLAAESPNVKRGSLMGAWVINRPGQILVWSKLDATVGCWALLTPVESTPDQPEAPGSVLALASNGRVELSWNSVYSATGYNVKRATSSGGPYTTIATGVTDTWFGDTAVVNGTRYYYVVSSVAGDYESANSPEATAQPMAPPLVPNAPTDLTGSLVKGGKSVNLAWTQPTNTAIRWNRVYRSTDRGASYTQLAVINAGTRYTDDAMSRGVTYTYAVTALNSNGQESPISNTVTAVRIK